MPYQPLTPVQLAVRTLPKRRKLKKPLSQLFPTLIEKKFRKLILSLVNQMKMSVQNILIPELPGLVSESKRDSWKEDETVVDKLRSLLTSVGSSLEEEFNEEAINRMIASVGDDLNSFNRAQVHKVFKSVLGVDLLSSEPAIAEAISGFVAENISLITSIKQNFLAQTEQVVLRGIRSGLRHEEIAKQLLSRSNKKGFKSRIGVAESRAELIARDQTNKLYGQLTEMRQTAAGIEKYIWRTAGDERVRPEHEEREGKEFSWNDPPEDGHPGEPINCRCYAEPVINIESI